MQITNNDICGMDNKTKINKANKNTIDDVDDEEVNEEINGEYYNPNWTLRKCASKLFDRISILFPKLSISYSKPILEIEIQSQDWIKKYIFVI